MPAGHDVVFDAGETCGLDHVGEGIGFWKLPDRFDQIAIGLGVAGDRAAKPRDHIERKQIVDPIEAGHIDGREFQAQKPRARFSTR